jgi:hypothetical protein
MKPLNPKYRQDATAFLNSEQINDPISVIRAYFDDFSPFSARNYIYDLLMLSVEGETITILPQIDRSNLMYFVKVTMGLLDANGLLLEMIDENTISYTKHPEDTKGDDVGLV